MKQKLKLDTLRVFLLPLLVLFTAFVTSCASNREIISGINEKEANIILVLLESKGIPASKTSAGGGGMTSESVPKYSISVPDKYSISAISYLNQNGFPKQKGTSLLELFSKQGLMTSDKEETIRYQAGLAQQLTNTIMMIDGVIDASVQLSFPQEKEEGLGQEVSHSKITAAVYVKHQSAIDDPNSHLENKIKRLISGSITGLDLNDVTVVSDRSRFTDISLADSASSVGAPAEYVSIWSIVMSKDSATTFRTLFFLLMAIILILAVSLGWLIWKCYPHLKREGGFKELFSPIPWLKRNPPQAVEGAGETANEEP